MSDEKPVWAFVLSLLAGIFILINGFIVAVGASISLSAISWFAPSSVSGFLLLLAALIIIFGTIFGFVIIGAAAFMYSSKRSRVRAAGIVVLIFSLLSLPIGGGFFIGMILGVIGGALAIAWEGGEGPKKKPELPPPPL